jgi:hypothetical protein
MALKGTVLANGVSGRTGQPILSPTPASQFASELRKSLIERTAPAMRAKEIIEFQARAPRFRAPDLSDPNQAGWTLLYHETDREIAGLLDELVKARGGDTFVMKSAESTVDLLSRWQALDRRPYYVLIAAPPDRIPFSLHAILDCAVGRVWFQTPEDFKTYVSGVLQSEDENFDTLPSRRAVFFATDYDDVTWISRQYLAEPLCELVKERCFETTYIDGAEATTGRLREAVATRDRGRAAALLFSATHGAGFRGGDALQRELQGALVCNDDLFSARDITGDVALPSGMAFFFACYGAGTPSQSDFALWCPDYREQLQQYVSDKDFLAALPTRLLSNSQPSLAVVAHVDPAWMHSFVDTRTWKPRRNPFETAVRELLRGAPVGYAMREFTSLCNRYNHLLLDLQIRFTQAKAEKREAEPILDQDLFGTWILRTDTQNYLILGDPAARLSFAD